MISFFRNSKGTAAIEFALALPILLLLLSGLVNFGLIIAKKNALTGIVSVGMLYAFGNQSTPALVQTSMAASTDISPLTLTVTQTCECLDGSQPLCVVNCSDGKLPAKYVNITANSTVNLVVPAFVITNPFPITVTGSMRVQ